MAHVVSIPVGSGAQACAFHRDAPEKTAIDWIIETDHLVNVRTDPENEFAYKVVETLREGGRPVEIPFLVDSTTRLRLASNPEDVVLFAFDAAAEEWRKIAYLTPDYRKMVEKVRLDMGNWGASYDPARFEIFEALQDHPDNALRQLAILELDKAPYELLRGIDLKIPVDSLLADLWTVQEIPYQSIRILLLGLSKEQAARTEIHRFIARAAQGDTSTNLGAFATALVEIDGPAGLERLERAMLRDPAQSLGKLEQIVEALAIHSGAGSAEVKNAIDAALDRLVRARPEAAPLVARQFGVRSDWSQANRLRWLVQERKLSNSADLMAVAIYVAQAKATDAPHPLLPRAPQ